MERKIVGMLVVTLLIATAVLPVVSSWNDIKDGKNVSMLNKNIVSCQNVGQPIVLTVGVCDDFDTTSPPNGEPTSPSSELLAWIAAHHYYNDTKDCDEDPEDRYWAHTFNLTGYCCDCNIVKATLEITIRNDEENLRDHLKIGCITSDSDTWEYNNQLQDVGFPLNIPTTQTINLDFMLDSINTYCWVDVAVDDDSPVDCAILTIWCCEPDVEFDKLIFDKPNNKLVDQINADIGGTVTFVFHIINQGNCNFTRFVIEDTLPDCLEYIDGSSKIGMFLPGNPTIDGNVHTWDFIYPDELPPGYYLSMEFNALVVSCGVNKNCANVTAYSSPNCSDTSAQDCATVNVDCGGGCIDPPPNLVAWWPLDEDVGRLTADIIGDNHGDWMGSPIPVPGKVAGALRFPTDNDYVRVKGPAPDLNFDKGDFTIDCCVYPHSPGDIEDRTIISKRAGTAYDNLGYCLFVNEAGNLAFILGTGTGFKRWDSPLAVPNNQWTFVAAVVGRSWPTPRLLLYTCNIATGWNIPDFTSTVTNSGDLYIGKDHFISAHAFPGIIDEVELFDRALNEGELWQICVNGPKCKPDLCCNGSCSWSDVKPGGTVTCTFTVSNCGDPGSKLDWEITSFPPGWGAWQFLPSSGTGLTPAGSPQTITATVTAPNDKEKTFTGEIILCNSHNPNDCCRINISLTTPKNKAINTMPLFLRFLELHPHMFPLLQLLLNLPAFQ